MTDFGTLTWSTPDAYGIISAEGVKRLTFQHEGRELEVRAVHDDEHWAWLVAVKEADRFVAPRDAFTLSNEKIIDARQTVFADLLPRSMTWLADEVKAGKVELLDLSVAPSALRWEH